MNEPITNLTLDDLELSPRIRNVFAHPSDRYKPETIQTVKELCSLTESDLYVRNNFGEKSLAQVKKALAKYGLCLADCKRPPAKSVYPRTWETIDEFTSRLRVPGGWLVAYWNYVQIAEQPRNPTAPGLCFVPCHEWELERKEKF